MEGDLNDLKYSRLFAELRESDREAAPPFGALTSPPHLAPARSPRRERPAARWALAATLLAATGLVMIKLAVIEPPAPAEPGASGTDWWSSPTDCLLDSADSFGSLETWQSPTDSLFDFAPINENT